MSKSSKRLAKIGFKSYKSYLLSDHWNKKRHEYFSVYGCQCQECGVSNKVIHIHHLTYENIGNENLTDLISLCEKCHSDKHKKRIDRKSTKATDCDFRRMSTSFKSITRRHYLETLEELWDRFSRKKKWKRFKNLNSFKVRLIEIAKLLRGSGGRSQEPPLGCH